MIVKKGGNQNENAVRIHPRMIYRVTTKLASRLAVTPAADVPRDPNPLADWSANLFMAGRVPGILLTNTASLYSLVMPARGLTRPESFAKQCLIAIASLLHRDGYAHIFDATIAPCAGHAIFAKSLNRAVTGSMVDLVHLAQYALADGHSLPDVWSALNKAPMSCLGYLNPREAFAKLASCVPGK